MEEEKTLKQSILELVRFAVIALLIVVPIRLFIIEPFVVSGSSMFPTFENADYLIVDKFSYEIGNPKRDDVVVFKYPNDTTKYFIKRVIGLPGDTVDISGSEITITNGTHKNGFILEEPYVKNMSDDQAHFVLKENEYFVMGDNRTASSDSRYWGPVERDLFVGRAFLRLMPFNNIDIFPGNYKQIES